MMHIHIDCICVAFLQCAFLKVSSSWVHEWMQNHNDYIFPAVRVQMCPQSTWIKAKIVTLTAFVHCVAGMVSTHHHLSP